VRVLPLVVAIAVGCNDAPALTSRVDAIHGGTAAPDDGAVVAIGAATVGCTEQLDVFCTGTLIAPRAVLTAAHCARATAGRLAVFLGADVAGRGEVHDVVRAIVHPDYVDDVANADIAVLVLATTPSAAPAAMASSPFTTADVGRTVRAIGFGATDGTGAGTGVRRQGPGMVDAVVAPTFRMTPAPGMTCQGDSGGPVLIDRGDGEVVAGVTSQGDVHCETYADNVDVAAYRAFIDDAVMQAMAWTPNGGAGAMCEAGCITDDDCAFGLECELPTVDATEGLCVRAPLSPGTLDADCTRDDQCDSGTCARVPGEQACRCHVPCETAGDGGCNAGGGSPGFLLWLAAALFFASRDTSRLARSSRAPSRTRRR
jgi:hypothetical protein